MGVAKDEIIDGTSALEEIKRRYIGNPDFANFPRKFKTALTGHPSHDVSPETNDVSFVGTVHPEHGPGFDLWVGGGLAEQLDHRRERLVGVVQEDVVFAQAVEQPAAFDLLQSFSQAQGAVFQCQVGA